MIFQDLVMEIDENNHEEFLKRDLSVLNFFSDWHMGCLMILPVLESLAEELSEKICFGKVNIEESEGLAEKHDVSTVPCLIIFKKGLVIDRIENVCSEEILRERICCLI